MKLTNPAVMEVDIRLKGCFTHFGEQGKEYGGKKRWTIKNKKGADGADLEKLISGVEPRDPHTHKTCFSCANLGHIVRNCSSSGLKDV